MFQVAIPIPVTVAHPHRAGIWAPRRFRVVEVAAGSQAEALAFVEHCEGVTGCSILITSDHEHALEVK